ncbi:MAG TPA: toast rack family protein, partial [Candidatus Acidoferrales bacterium]|nr:toast rack family protein [Candidatus Acidoferrales bacterium]
MDPSPMRRHRSFIGPVILICIGVFFLVANLVPSFDPWLILMRYWPVILIVIGLGKVWDYYAARRDAGGMGGGSDVSGVLIAVVLLMLLLGLGVWRTDRRSSTNGSERHDTKTVDLQGATAVTANLNFPAGQLNINGGSSHLVDADFSYTSNSASAGPQMDYTVSSGHGQLNINENSNQVRFGTHDERWDLHFNNEVPLDLTLQMGAGQSNLRLAGLDLTHLEVHMGAGEMVLDLTGQRKQNLSADIHGGVGQARIRLPK